VPDESRNRRLSEHMLHCQKYPVARVAMPKDKKILLDGQKVEVKPTIKFEHPERGIPVAACVFADSESVLRNVEEVVEDADPGKSSTSKKQHHVPMSFGYVVNTSLPDEVLPDFNKDPVIIREENCTQTFLKEMVDLSVKFKKMYERNIKMEPLTSEEVLRHDNADTCYLCEKPYTEDDYKVRDHCHVTGKYRGPAHNTCNLNSSNPTFLPVYMHNLSKYDAHFLIRELGDIDADIRVIPNTTENFISFSIVPKDGLEIRFIDTIRFMSSSLESLANNLSHDKFNNVARHFGNEHIELLRRKGVFCYDYMDDLNKLNQTKLPPRKDFHSKLYETNISKKEYRHAQNVWKTFKCKTLGEYSDLYLKLDVLLLADIFQAFREVCMEAYKLDPAWYYTVPGLAWDAALRHTKVELELIQDEEMLFMLEKGIRGGVAQCCKRYAKAKNKYLDEHERNVQDTIAYLDAINLYGWSMSQKLPTHGFHFIDPEHNPKVAKENIQNLDPDGELGYIFEVDIQYPEELHDAHKDLPFLPETMVPPGGKNPKLLTTLYDKKKYVVHYRTLQQAMQHGLRVTKVHRVIGFFQSKWLESYIAANTRRRQLCTNAFEKDFFKLMNNAVYGKTMENVRNRIKLELVTKLCRLRKLIKSPFFKGRIIYGENLCAVMSHKKEILMNKAIYVGMVILDLSKYLMYDFHYRIMRQRFQERLSLMYMDTDSFVYFVQNCDFYSEMKDMAEHFDTSDYPKNHFCYSDTNKKVLGKFKDEANSIPVKCFVGLRAKMYAMKYGGKILKRAKGVKRYALSRKISYNDYVRCLKENTIQRTSFRMIRSRHHIVHTVEMNKISLSAHDDKRFILPNKVDTLPHGHVLIPFILDNESDFVTENSNLDHIQLEEEEEPMEISSEEEVGSDLSDGE
jgi:hypothetical protein